jgi:uncharacterized protein
VKSVRLDPRAPLVLDTRELGRRPGSQRKVSFTAPAPADLGIEVLRVPEGSPVDFELRLEAVMEGVLVTGQAHAGLEGECVRCLETIHDDVVADFQELFAYEESDTATHPQDGEDDDVSRLEGDLIDLEPTVRDTVVLGLPLSPLCRDDCQGLCPRCGADLNAGPCSCPADDRDPRWAALDVLDGLRNDTLPSDS